MGLMTQMLLEHRGSLAEGATARYAHLANDPVKSAANRIASRIAEVSG